MRSKKSDEPKPQGTQTLMKSQRTHILTVQLGKKNPLVLSEQVDSAEYFQLMYRFSQHLIGPEVFMDLALPPAVPGRWSCCLGAV